MPSIPPLIFAPALPPNTIQKLDQPGAAARPTFWDLTTAGQFGGGLDSDGNLPFWGDDPDAWDQVYLGGKRFPGIARITCKTKQRRDRKVTPGRAGHRATALGSEPADISIEFTLWTKQQWVDFTILAVQLRPPPKSGSPKPMSIYHPSLAAIGISQVEAVGISPPEMSKIDGAMKVVVTLEEFVSAPTQIKTHKKSDDLISRAGVVQDSVNQVNAKAAKAAANGLSSPKVRGP